MFPSLRGPDKKGGKVFLAELGTQEKSPRSKREIEPNGNPRSRVRALVTSRVALPLESFAWSLNENSQYRRKKADKPCNPIKSRKRGICAPMEERGAP